MREVGDDADKWAPGGSERERDGRLGRLGWGFLGRTVVCWAVEKRNRRGELGWFGKEGREVKVCFFIFSN